MAQQRLNKKSDGLEIGEEYLTGHILLGEMKIPLKLFPNKTKTGNQPDWHIKGGGALWVQKKKAPHEVQEEKVE